MPLFTNVIPLDDRMRNASHQAGIAIIRAIQEAFYGLEAYEFAIAPLPEVTITRLRIAGARFERTAPRYRELAELIPERSLPVSDDVLKAFDIAFEFHRLMGGAVLSQKFADDWKQRILVKPIPSRALIDFARSVSEEMGRGLREVPLEHSDAKTGQRIASDIAVVQALGLAATKALEAYQS